MPLFDGYRAMVWLGETDDDTRLFHDAVVQIEGEGDSIGPGQQGLVRVQPQDPDRWAGVQVGSELELYEGQRLIGVLQVLELFPVD